jgi:hypothetical protein
MNINLPGFNFSWLLIKRDAIGPVVHLRCVLSLLLESQILFDSISDSYCKQTTDGLTMESKTKARCGVSREQRETTWTMIGPISRSIVCAVLRICIVVSVNCLGTLYCCKFQAGRFWLRLYLGGRR